MQWTESQPAGREVGGTEINDLRDEAKPGAENQRTDQISGGGLARQCTGYLEGE